jgi:hypothetical protein
LAPDLTTASRPLRARGRPGSCFGSRGPSRRCLPAAARFASRGKSPRMPAPNSRGTAMARVRRAAPLHQGRQRRTVSGARLCHDLAGDKHPRRGAATARPGAAAPRRPQRHGELVRGRLLVAGHLQLSLHRAGRCAAQTYRREALEPMAGMPPCVVKQVTRPIRNREAAAASRT